MQRRKERGQRETDNHTQSKKLTYINTHRNAHVHRRIHTGARRIHSQADIQIHAHINLHTLKDTGRRTQTNPLTCQRGYRNTNSHKCLRTIFIYPPYPHPFLFIFLHLYYTSHSAVLYLELFSSLKLEINLNIKHIHTIPHICTFIGKYIFI